MMPASLQALRIVVGLLSIFFAHFLGRSVAVAAKGERRKRPLYTWAFRYALCLGALCYHGVDGLAIVILILDVILFAAGWWDEWRPKHEEDLTRKMFGDDE